MDGLLYEVALLTKGHPYWQQLLCLESQSVSPKYLKSAYIWDCDIHRCWLSSRFECLLPRLPKSLLPSLMVSTKYKSQFSNIVRSKIIGRSNRRRGITLDVWLTKRSHIRFRLSLYQFLGVKGLPFKNQILSMNLFNLYSFKAFGVLGFWGARRNWTNTWQLRIAQLIQLLGQWAIDQQGQTMVMLVCRPITEFRYRVGLLNTGKVT
jgi:hypothetical protein